MGAVAVLAGALAAAGASPDGFMAPRFSEPEVLGAEGAGLASLLACELGSCSRVFASGLDPPQPQRRVNPIESPQMLKIVFFIERTQYR